MHPCRYHAACYDFNSEHMERFAHPPGSAVQIAYTHWQTTGQVPCRYGPKCFNSQAHHRAKFAHACPAGASCAQQRDHQHLLDFYHVPAGATTRSAPRPASGAASPPPVSGTPAAAPPPVLSAPAVASVPPPARFKVPRVPAAAKAAQETLGAQSLRRQSPDFGPAIQMNPHWTRCFEQMLANEKRLCGEWAVFYHSYSYAALIYEVQAAVAAVLFRFQSQYAALPRLLKEPYQGISTVEELKSKVLRTVLVTGLKDHDPRFRNVAISGTSSLLAPDSEAPPKSAFVAGYSCTDLSLMDRLMALLVACGVPDGMKLSLAKKITDLSQQHGLDCRMVGGSACASGSSGHLLQVFIRRPFVNKFAYGALPYGHEDASRPDLAAAVEGPGPIQGQVRILTDPSAFMRGHTVRMFTFSADTTFHHKRRSYQEALTALLQPIIGTVDARVKAATGIYAGRLPKWFTAGCDSDEDDNDA